MPIETKKVLWTALSVLIVLVVAFGIALAFVMPKGDSAMAPASIGATTPPRVAAPEAYIRSAEPAPVPLAPGSTAPASDSGVIIIYGERPATPALPATKEPLAQTSAAAAVPAATVPASQAKPYTPAPPASAAPRTPAQTPAQTPAVTPATAKPAAPARPAAAIAVTEYWIQAASFTSRTRAEDLQRSLVEKGLSSLITIKEIDGTPYFRVRIGPYKAKTEADGWLTKVRQMAGCEEAYVSMQTIQRSS